MMMLDQANQFNDTPPVVWDDQALTRTLGHTDANVHQRILLRFAAHTGKQLLELVTLCEQGDFHAIEALAHNAKTSARTVGAMQLGALCDHLETCCAAGDHALARQRVVDVLSAYDAIQSYLPQPTPTS